MVKYNMNLLNDALQDLIFNYKTASEKEKPALLAELITLKEEIAFINDLIESGKALKA